MTDLSYAEKQDKLQIRIRAHKQFANFDIEEWIDGFLSRRPRHAIFDLGCGNGNHLGLYLKHVGPSGTVAGLDREAALVSEARRTYADSANLDVRVGSMNERLPFENGSFDTCFSNFAIYNAADPEFTLGELRRVVRPGGEVVLIGPTRENAKEIYEFNERVTGQAIDPVTLIRTDRLRQEILPIVRRIFGNAQEEVINSFLTFPNQDEFLRYYTSTMLFEEGAEKQGKTMEEMRAALDRDRDIPLSKQMLAVIATA
jgi:ubiquinone/menaquinone biosynthesis C-methylase UbiE